jgi:hypothetical protein
MAVIWIDSGRFGAAFDPDAAAYIAAVEAADTQALEPAVRTAINDFVVGCKADGIWNAIKASCILAGARTLTGALVPLVGTAPTNFNFDSGDYNRKTGLVGDGSTKYLDSNRNNNADSHSKHLGVYATVAAGLNNALIGAGLFADSGNSYILQGSGRGAKVNSGSSSAFIGVSGSRWSSGFIGVNRSNDSDFEYRDNKVSATQTNASASAFNGTIWIFARGGGPPVNLYDGRLSFYSIGESLDLALLDARVTALINAFAAAIP